MPVRRNLYSLTAQEVATFTTALNAMKASGAYDDFTRRHLTAMMSPTLLPGETRSQTQRNVAHRGPAFLPWHRQSLLEFERALGVALPYWRWEAESSQWRTARIWSIVGGNGSTTSNPPGLVQDGPFRHWTSIIWNASQARFQPRAGIRRRFSGTGGFASASAVATLQRIATYDAPSWNEFTTAGFRSPMERRHNTVHSMIGGDMAVGTSPNDPVFWLHHANCDRIWAERQERNGHRGYLPTTGGPPGHNLRDAMAGLRTSGVTPASVLDFRALGISYDTLEA